MYDPFHILGHQSFPPKSLESIEKLADLNVQLPTRSRIERAQQRAREFVLACRTGETEFSLTRGGSSSCFSRCFGLFNIHLLGLGHEISGLEATLAARICADLDETLAKRKAQGADPRQDKHYLQLLTFSLSALATIGKVADAPLEDHIKPLLLNADNLDNFLTQAGVFEGRATSGNLAMFHAILLWHAQIYLGLDTSSAISKWNDLHLQRRNRFGFWGSSSNMTYLQFQNGFHQYEMLNYPTLRLDEGAELAARNAALMADRAGQFAPYPGGGGCYDFDAVALIAASKNSRKYAPLLTRTLDTILSAQNDDGGFCESRIVRPRSPKNLFRQIAHCIRPEKPGATERLRYFATLQRPRHDIVTTHWTSRHRRWDESDLWDTWFRLMAIATIDKVLAAGSGVTWRFIDYPGIGYKPDVPKTQTPERNA
ncbi:MAG: hypothetical protein RIQ81_609 [Pseudomonadota bacterium]|jgi:hypothetical protein